MNLTVLVNLSNHPLSEWSTEQISKAKESYGTIVDVQFPTIVPTDETLDILKLAKSILFEIQNLNPTAVHIMGEHTFTYCFIRLAQQLGISCVASTTSRDFEEIADGLKIRKFQFKRFREYPNI